MELGRKVAVYLYSIGIIRHICDITATGEMLSVRSEVEYYSYADKVVAMINNWKNSRQANG